MLWEPGAFNSCKGKKKKYEVNNDPELPSCMHKTIFGIKRAKIFSCLITTSTTPKYIPWPPGRESKAGSTRPSTDPWCRFPRFPSAHGSCHGPGYGTTSSREARTVRGRTSRSSRPTARHSYRRCSMGRSRWWCLKIVKERTKTLSKY